MNIEINTETLKSDAGRMNEQLTRVRTAMNNMNSAISTLNGMWKGAANQAFTAQYASDYDNMTAVCDTVGKIISDMKSAADKYNKCDSEVKSIINSIRI